MKKAPALKGKEMKIELHTTIPAIMDIEIPDNTQPGDVLAEVNKWLEANKSIAALSESWRTSAMVSDEEIFFRVAPQEPSLLKTVVGEAIEKGCCGGSCH